MLTSLPEIDRVRWLAYRNDSGEEVPAFALVRPTGADADGTLVVDKPDTDGQLCYVNGPVPCPDGGYGLCTVDDPVFVAFDTGETPAFGQTWGAAAGGWLLTSGKTGWRVLGANDLDRAITLADRVRSAGGTPAAAGAALYSAGTAISVPTGLTYASDGVMMTLRDGYAYGDGGADFFDGTNNQWVVIPSDGVYSVTLCVWWSTNATGLRVLGLGYGNSISDDTSNVYSTVAAADGTETRQSVTVVRAFYEDTYLHLRLLQSSGSSLDVAHAELEIQRLGPGATWEVVF